MKLFVGKSNLGRRFPAPTVAPPLRADGGEEMDNLENFRQSTSSVGERERGREKNKELMIIQRRGKKKK